MTDINKPTCFKGVHKVSLSKMLAELQFKSPMLAMHESHAAEMTVRYTQLHILNSSYFCLHRNAVPENTVSHTL